MSNIVPEGWFNAQLSDLVDVRSSNVDKKSSEGETAVQLCNYTDVYYNNQITSKIDFMQATAKQREIDRFLLEYDDVIITKDSETPDDIAVPAHVNGFYTELPDTSEKTDNGRGGVSCNNEENTQTSSKKKQCL